MRSIGLGLVGILAGIALSAQPLHAQTPEAQPQPTQTLAPERPRELVLDQASGLIIDAELYGRPLRLRVDPSALGAVLLNKSVAEEAGLKNEWPLTLAVGPMRLTGDSIERRMTIAGRSSLHRLAWFDGDLIEGADGLINPAHLPYESVLFRLGEPADGERAFEFGMRFDIERGLYHRRGFGGGEMLVRFTLDGASSTVTAAAGAVIARRYGGDWSGPIFTAPVRFTIPRPVRAFVLERPFLINQFPIHRLTVRVDDNRGVYRLPPTRQPLETAQSDAVVITGRRRFRLGDPAAFWMMIGREQLESCSSLRYERKRRRLTINCAPGALAAGEEEEPPEMEAEEVTATE